MLYNRHGDDSANGVLRVNETTIFLFDGKFPDDLQLRPPVGYLLLGTFLFSREDLAALKGDLAQ